MSLELLPRLFPASASSALDRFFIPAASPPGSLACARSTAAALRATQRGGAYVSLENPASSRLFDYPPIVAALTALGAHPFVFDQCPYGTPYRKPTRIFYTLPGLGELARRCSCRRHSEVMEGKVRLADGAWYWRTALASAYPPAWCRAVAAVAAAAAPVEARVGAGAGVARGRPGWGHGV